MKEKILKNFLYYILLYGFVVLVALYIIGRIRSWVVFDNYTKTTYGIISHSLKVEYKGRFAWSNIRGIHGDRHRWWVSAYEVKAPFMDKSFEIWVDKRDYTIYGTDFYEVLSNDPKFQHLYSEWVKNQVGIEDENVELGFTGNFDKPYIDFDKITSLSDDYREVFENTHNLYLDRIKIDNELIIENDIIKEFYIYKDSIYTKIANFIGQPDKICLFLYINNYRFMNNYPEDELVSIDKQNENGKYIEIKE